MVLDTRTFDRFTAAFRYASDDTWGLVSQLEQQYDLGRQTISLTSRYAYALSVNLVLTGQKASPKPSASCISHLELPRSLPKCLLAPQIYARPPTRRETQ